MVKLTQPDTMSNITVAIHTFNEEKNLKDCIDSALTTY